jgi:hypothetical protein
LVVTAADLLERVREDAFLSGGVVAAPARGAATPAGDLVPIDQVVQHVEQIATARDRADIVIAPIKSQEDLQNYLASANSGSPLYRLSKPSQERFLASLRFNENGLTSFEYVDLERELSAEQAYRLMALFGAQHVVSLFKNIRQETPADRTIMASGPNSQDYPGYACQSRATCAKSFDTICMSSC